MYPGGKGVSDSRAVGGGRYVADSGSWNSSLCIDDVWPDNTNADVATRAYWVAVAREFKIPIRCIRFTASARLAEHNDSVRALNPALVSSLDQTERGIDTSGCIQMNPEGRTMLPGIAFRSFVQRFTEPTLAEGFQDIFKVDFEVCDSSYHLIPCSDREIQFKGTPEQRQIWSKYWVSKFST